MATTDTRSLLEVAAELDDALTAHQAAAKAVQDHYNSGARLRTTLFQTSEKVTVLKQELADEISGRVEAKS